MGVRGRTTICRASRRRVVMPANMRTSPSPTPWGPPLWRCWTRWNEVRPGRGWGWGRARDGAALCVVHCVRGLASPGRSSLFSIVPPSPRSLSPPYPHPASAGDGRADFIDALTVALDMLYKQLAARPELGNVRVPKRIVLVSPMHGAAAPDPDDAFKATLVRKLAEQSISLDVMVLGRDPGEAVGKHVADATAYNLDQLRYITDRVTHTLHRVAGRHGLAGAFRAREPGATAYYSGPLTLSDEMVIAVSACAGCACTRVRVCVKGTTWCGDVHGRAKGGSCTDVVGWRCVEVHA